MIFRKIAKMSTNVYASLAAAAIVTSVLGLAGCKSMRDSSTTPATEASSMPLRLERIIPLPEVKGGFDLMAVDLAGQRLFIAAEDNHSIEVLDLAAMKPLRSVPGFDEPKWFNYRPEAKRLYVATAGDGRVTALNAETLEPVKVYQFREKCNNLRYDATRKLLFVGVGKTFGTLGVIDTREDKIQGEIPLANFPKQFEIDSNLIYANVPSAGHVAVVDIAKGTVTATWPVTEGKENVPMGLDSQHRRLFVGCVSGKLVIFDMAAGKSIASLDIGKGSDGIYYDAKRKLIYISCAAGVIEVIRQQDADHYLSVAKISTADGAGTSLFVPELDELFLAVPQKDGRAAEIRLYRAAAL